MDFRIPWKSWMGLDCAFCSLFSVHLDNAPCCPAFITFGMTMPFSRLHSIKRVQESLLPTPLHRLDALSRVLGIDLWCKRDDLTGFGFGGNKTRKLDYLLYAAREDGATDLVAPGGVQSNFCRATAAYASRHGLGCHLLLGGSASHDSDGGNVVLDRMFGATIHRVHADDWSEWEAALRDLADELKVAGRRPWTMPVGGSSPLGACGYASAMEELLADCEREGVKMDFIVHATSSGGTQAGLLVGKRLSGWEGSIIGIAAAKWQRPFAEEVLALARAAAERFEISIPASDVIVEDRFIGEAYAIPSQEGREAQRIFARTEGIVLDDVYTAKAAAGLIGLCADGTIQRGSNAVFIHTGGSPQVFVL
jgi:L-cysteate sulfo-lyase